MQKEDRDQFRKNKNINKNKNMNKYGNGNKKRNKAEIQLSKKLSFILRHGANELGINMSSDGYVFVDEMCSKGSINVPFSTIEKVVLNNDKKRFQLIKAEDDRWKIRASQGHTIKEVNQDQLLTKISN